MPNHIIFDNFLPPSLVSITEDKFNDPNLPWFYNHSTVGFSDFMNNDYENQNIKDTYQFNHTVWNNDRFMTQKCMSDITLEILNHLQTAAEKEIKKIGRIKANLTLKSNWTEDWYHPPHYDATEEDAMTFVYFINDSDGDLRVFDKQIKSRYQNRNEVIDSYKGLSCIDRITPKKGLGVLFPSITLHSGSCPIEMDKRMVINYVIGF